MTITLNADYDVTLNTALLGYVGETQARPVSIEGMEIDDGADRYVLTIDYGDGVSYEVDITGGQWTPTADILRSAQTVSCQIAAKKLSGDEYILVKKSRIFRLRIGAAIGDTAIPSPDVAVDALDRIDAIGRQAHADMQTAVNAAETATTAADNAAKSATAAGVSADTAEQAAECAETAQTAAETSATQAETAKQGAEIARQQAVTAQNAAKTSADQAAESAKQTTADKTATAGYAQTAKTHAASTAADRQAVTDMAAQVTADKATVANHASQVAEDRTAAETAAQTAQAVADSLPDDYTTAVEKIAENTAEIANVKLTDKELQRRVNALYDMGNGITHRFETDSDTTYAKAVPTGGKLMSVKNVGGRSVVWNQLVDFSKSKETTADGVTVTFSGDGIVTLNGTSIKDGNLIAVAIIKNVKDHKYLMIANPLSDVYGAGKLLFTSQVYGADTTGHGAIIVNGSSNATWYYTLYVYNGVTYDNVKLQPQIFDLTAMFGTGNEPSTVEEFEKMFPADYYPYCAGEIISAGTEEVVEQGKNLLNSDDYYSNYKQPDGSYVNDSVSFANIDIPIGNYIGKTIIATLKATVPSALTSFFWAAKINGTKIESSYEKGERVLSNTTGIARLTVTPKTKNDTLAMSYGSGRGNVIVRDIQIEESSTATAYTPYHRNEYSIPESIRNLPGYGWSAGTARNYVDYENKKYVQCVNSVDLGTLTWLYQPEQQRFYAIADSIIGKFFESFGIVPNIIIAKYDTVRFNDITTKIDNMKASAVKTANDFISIRNTAYTDATTFKQAMQGVMLYYELETPIITDISTLIDDDFLRNIEVEAGGSITFKNGNDDYRTPVPNEEEYVVKLSEVGGSV